MPPLDPELQYALEMFSRFFDLIHQPLAIINRDGEYVYYNQESADLDGYTVEQALGHHMLDVYPKMKESQSTMLHSLNKEWNTSAIIRFITTLKGRRWITSTPLRRCMHATVRW